MDVRGVSLGTGTGARLKDCAPGARVIRAWCCFAHVEIGERIGRVAMAARQVAGLLALALAGVAVTQCPAEESLGEDPVDLVERLPTNTWALPAKVALEERIAKLGDRAIPALEKELRVGIRFRELNTLLGAGNSRRCAVAGVLARMPGQRSTDLLVRSLADPPDNYGMRYATLKALEARTLSAEQIVGMIGNHEPEVVLAGIAHAERTIEAPKIKAAVERIFQSGTAKAQFHNEYGASTAGADALWEVRLCAGQALKRDMVPEMRARAKVLLAELQEEALHPTKPNDPVMASYASAAEQKICSRLEKLSALGQPVKDLVQGAAVAAEGDAARVLDMALARLGDESKLAQVADHLTSAQSPTVRFCAAITLRRLANRSAIPALRRALTDPYRRLDGSCVRIKADAQIHPVRLVAADALIDLGEDPKEVRAKMRE